MCGPRKNKTATNLKELLSLLWLARELARWLPKLRRYSPGPNKTASFEESPGLAESIQLYRKALFAVVR